MEEKRTALTVLEEGRMLPAPLPLEKNRKPAFRDKKKRTPWDVRQERGKNVLKKKCFLVVQRGKALGGRMGGSEGSASPRGRRRANLAFIAEKKNWSLFTKKRVVLVNEEKIVPKRHLPE